MVITMAVAMNDKARSVYHSTSNRTEFLSPLTTTSGVSGSIVSRPEMKSERPIKDDK